ncbi:putative oxidoreductase [Larkinella arboricola]|uniref:Putative oxidoreductase n=1 Tax=Larkinella arboricola TaxID=643671 RepID=A0A327X1E6_LARAB|nr:DoxX family protein [Larkinella arboricola]RAK00216.1 putative oxidoreductase [Larkinella arboricola]
MERSLSQYAPYFYALLRIVAGLLFAMHGSQKLFGIPGGGDPVPLVSLMGFAGIVELVGGLLIAFGLFTRAAAFVASGQMAVAYFMAHIPQGPVPLLNKGELALMFCFLFLYIVTQGPGIWSLDASRQKRG